VAAAPTARVTADDLRVPPGVLLLFGAALAVLLLVATIAFVPARALPVKVAAVAGRREELLFVALCTAGVGVVVLLLVALASA